MDYEQRDLNAFAPLIGVEFIYHIRQWHSSISVAKDTTISVLLSVLFLGADLKKRQIITWIKWPSAIVPGAIDEIEFEMNT